MNSVKLPKAVNKDAIYTHCEIKKPSPIVLANTKKEVDNGNWYLALCNFIFGCLVSFYNDETRIEDKQQIHSLVKWLPFKSAEFLAIKILLLHNNNEDGIEAVYECPRCDNQIICELTDDEDTRDHISDLKVIKNDKEFIEYTLSESLQLDTDGILGNVSSIKMRFPALQDCITAIKKYGNEDTIGMQNGIFGECLISVNGNDLSDKDRRIWGKHIFDYMPDSKDLTNIVQEIYDYGYDPYLEKFCLKCRKKWKAVIPIYNFFDFAPKP